MRSTPYILATLISASFLGACAAAPSDSEEPTATSEAALKNTGGTKRSYLCEDGYCTCTGDAECNDMFSDGVCGDGPRSAICHINEADVPRCRCAIARTVQPWPWPVVVQPVPPIATTNP